MTFSHLPPFLTSTFTALAHWLHKRSAARLPGLLVGILLAHGRRTVTSWFRPAGITDDFRPAYTTVCAVGRKTDSMAITVVIDLVCPVVRSKRLLVGIDDTPTKRYGPCIEGAGIHHNPTPGPAGEKHFYGHVWVVLAALAKHKDWGSIALPLQGQLYIRRDDIAKLPPERPRPFKTKLELAAEQLLWLNPWVKNDFEERWAVTDGGYAKKPFLRPARKAGWVVVSRLRKDAHLCDLPPAQRRQGQRGPTPIYGKNRIYLAEQAADPEGWQQVECEQYGEKVTKTIKTFLATWRPAGGVIRVVIVKEEDEWLPFFCTKAEATPEEIAEAMADRNALEQTNKDVKEVWGAEQQQVRNVDSNIGCFNLNLWMYSLTEAWAWDKPFEGLVDRSDSPWDSEWRRPSHADKRWALQREILQAEIEAVLSGRPTKEDFRALAQRLLDMAA
jgi:DDE superfamily endonuclease